MSVETDPITQRTRIEPVPTVSIRSGGCHKIAEGVEGRRSKRTVRTRG